MSAETGPGGFEQHRGKDEDRAAEHAPVDAKALAEGLLAQVLHETSRELETAPTNVSAATTVMLAVGRKYAGRPLVLEPILSELVEAVLMDQFGRVFARENWNAVAREVAQRLFEDPESQSRLHEFWQLLSAASP